MALRIFQAFLEDDTTIRISMLSRYDSDTLAFQLEARDTTHPLTLLKRQDQDSQLSFLLQSPFPLSLEEAYTLVDQDRNRVELSYGAIVRTPLFDETFFYAGADLGANYTNSETQFKLWAPISKQVFLVLNQIPHQMERGPKGVWHLTLPGDWDGASYHYLHRVNGEWKEVHDPYALSSVINSGDSIVINPKRLLTPTPLTTPLPLSQAIVYEMSVRDFSQQKEAGFATPGRFSALTESLALEGYPIGIDYLKELGISHVQLMPVYDFGSVDESYPQAVYNWGYDPVQYNVPEGSFSSDPRDPYARILELQEVIQAYHDTGIGLIMDVVYNHVYHADSFAFEKIVPGYFYRYDEATQLRTDGTFCGNDIASERLMVRQYIKHSLKQWVNLYGFDGFRFDLMGILDMETMEEIAAELQTLNPSIFLYGEGWSMPTGYPSDQLAHQYNAAHLPDLAFFNDEYRDCIKQVLVHPESLSEAGLHHKIETLLAGSYQHHFLRPTQSINYLECHDNATLFDYLALQNPALSEEDRLQAAHFGLKLVLISQGVPFLHSGQEFFRTKHGLENTYNSPDSINQLDWTRAIHYQEYIDSIRQWIALRKQFPILSQERYIDIEYSCDFYWLTESVLRYQVQDKKQQMQFLINFSKEEYFFQLDQEQTLLLACVETNNPNTTPLRLPGQDIAVLWKKKK